jgi:hypothetical protein
MSAYHQKKKWRKLRKRLDQVFRWLDSEFREIDKNESTYAARKERYKGTYKRGDG